MGVEVLGVGDQLGVGGDFVEQLIGDLDDGGDLHELADVEGGGEAGGAAGGHDVRGSGDVVAEGLGRGLADEESAGVADVADALVRVLDDEGEVLGGVLVGDGEGFVEVGDEGEAASGSEGVEGNVAAGEIGGLLEELGCDRLGQGFAGGDQDGGSEVVVLGLGEEVGGDEFGVGGNVGDDQGLGRSVDGVDADDSVEASLGGGDEAVAGSEDLVDGGD